MKRSLLLLSVLCILLFLLFAVVLNNDRRGGASQSQQRIETRGGVLPQPHAAIEGKAAERVMPFKLSSGDLKAAFLMHPTPELWLEFPATISTSEALIRSAPGNAKTNRVDLSPEARKALSTCWEVYLSAHYNISVAPQRDFDSLFAEKMRLSRAILATTSELQKSKIAAPNETRDISYYEAEDLMERFHAMAVKVIEQAIEYRK